MTLSGASLLNVLSNVLSTSILVCNMFDVSQPNLAGLLTFHSVCVGSLVLLWLAWRLDSILKTAARCPVRIRSDGSAGQPILI